MRRQRWNDMAATRPRFSAPDSSQCPCGPKAPAREAMLALQRCSRRKTKYESLPHNVEMTGAQEQERATRADRLGVRVDCLVVPGRSDAGTRNKTTPPTPAPSQRLRRGSRARVRGTNLLAPARARAPATQHSKATTRAEGVAHAPDAATLRPCRCVAARASTGCNRKRRRACALSRARHR